MAILGYLDNLMYLCIRIKHHIMARTKKEKEKEVNEVVPQEKKIKNHPLLGEQKRRKGQNH